MNIFLDNKKQIEEHNMLFKAGKTTFELGLNQFSDMVRNNNLTEVEQLNDKLFMSIFDIIFGFKS